MTGHTERQLLVDLDLAEDRAFQATFWRIQRLIWIVFLAVLVAAVLGFSGSGGLFGEVRFITHSYEVHMPRIGRWRTGDRIIFVVARADGQLRVDLGHDFLELYSIKALTPEPVEQRATAAGLVLLYDVRPGSRLALEIEPVRPAIGEEVSIGINGEVIRTRAWVWP